MDGDANETRPHHRRFFLRRGIASLTWRNAAENRRRHLLAEFLQRKSTLATQNLEIHLQNIDDVTDLSNDLLIKIFLFLPVESLCRLQYVCKRWFNLINSSTFIRYQAQQSETVLIYQKPIHTPFPIEGNPKCYFHFFSLDHTNHNFVESSLIGLADVLASCHGLILAVSENKILILMNPMTRKHIELPLGASTLDIHTESYSLAFCEHMKTYKIVHLFHEKEGYACEILSVKTRKWRTVEGPSSELLTNIKGRPISLGGSLYWMPWKKGCDYFVEMNVRDETFVPKKLPKVRAGCDRLIEIGGNLGFVTYSVDERIVFLQVWILMGGYTSDETWVKSHVINLKVEFGFPIPICCLRNGKEMVIASQDQNLSVYSFEDCEMKHVYVKENDEKGYQDFERLYIPHRNTLVSWEDNAH